MEPTFANPIRPLIEITETQSGQSARNADVSFFSTVFQSTIGNVQNTNAVQMNQEYKLATGRLDNPANLTLATTKANNAALLLMGPSNQALDAYDELVCIPL